jgi:hypothetical protein
MTTNYFEDVQALLKVESDAIAQTASRLDPTQVEHVVKLPVELPWQSRNSWVGKSGIMLRRSPPL